MSAMGQVRLAKGFIMNKLYSLGYIGAKHTDVVNLPKSCPIELRGYMNEAIAELRKEGLLRIKRTSYGEHVSAAVNGAGISYANTYRRHVNLPETDLRPRQTEVEPLTPDELRKLKLKKP